MGYWTDIIIRVNGSENDAKVINEIMTSDTYREKIEKPLVNTKKKSAQSTVSNLAIHGRRRMKSSLRMSLINSGSLSFTKTILSYVI